MKNNFSKAAGWIITAVIITGIYGLIFEELRTGDKKPFKYSSNKPTVPPNNQSVLDRIKEIAQADCEFSSATSVRSKGVSIKAYYPCTWKENRDILTKKPNLLCQFIKEEESKLYSFSVDISKVGVKLTPELIKKITSSEWLKNHVPELSEYISSKTLEIEGVKGSQLVTKKNLPDNNWVMYSFEISLYKGNDLIYITYALASSSDMQADKIFQEQTETFEKLAKRITFY